MIWLNIFGNDTLMMLAETLVIVIGSMLMGILLSHWAGGNLKGQVAELEKSIADEKRNAEDLRDQINELLQIREHLKNEISELRLKVDTQSRTIYEQNQSLYQKDGEHRHHQAELDNLNASLVSYQRRLKIIEEELVQAKNAVLIPHITEPAVTTRANYDHVSKLLGKPVTENDLNVIYGVGPKTSALLQSRGISTWAELSQVTIDFLKEILAEAGGVYKSLDPTSWPKQAFMAAQSEWRKLRIYQETLKKGEPG